MSTLRDIDGTNSVLIRLRLDGSTEYPYRAFDKAMLAKIKQRLTLPYGGYADEVLTDPPT